MEKLTAKMEPTVCSRKALKLTIALTICYSCLCACGACGSLYLRSHFFCKPRRNFTVKIAHLYHKVTNTTSRQVVIDMSLLKEFRGSKTNTLFTLACAIRHTILRAHAKIKWSLRKLRVNLVHAQQRFDVIIAEPFLLKYISGKERALLAGWRNWQNIKTVINR